MLARTLDRLTSTVLDDRREWEDGDAASDATSEEDMLPSEPLGTFDHAFWTTYAERLADRSPDRRRRMVRALAETVARLHEATRHERERQPDDDGAHSSTTSWTTARANGDAALRFDPTRLALDRRTIAREQQLSLWAMHDPPLVRPVDRREVARVHVVIDLYDLTTKQTFGILLRARTHDIVDGARLWSTLPYHVRSIHVVRPKHAPAWLWTAAIRCARRLLSAKLGDRLFVHEARLPLEELLLTGDAPVCDSSSFD